MIRIMNTFKLIPIACLLFIITITGFSQAKELADPHGSFVAVIVNDIDVSISWYQEVLGFELIDRVDVPERGFRQSNLKRALMDIELIELKTAISQEEVLSKNPSVSHIHGIFKVGFQVSDFDAWLLHLTNAKVEFGGSVVTDQKTGKRMLIIKDPDSNRIQLFEK